MSRHVSDKAIVQIIAGYYSGDPNTWYLNYKTLHVLVQLQQNTCFKLKYFSNTSLNSVFTV